ncbi:MAG: helix-turn-helix domain-containing protein [Sulfitobacter sp.]
MIQFPIPFFVSFSLLGLALFIYLKNGKNGLNLSFFALVLLTALQTFLVGLRWGFDVRAVAVFIPVFSAVVPSLVYCGVATFVRRDLRPRNQFFAHVAAPLMIVVLMVVYPDAIDGGLILLFSGYAVAILMLMRSGSDSLYLASFEKAGSAYRTIVFAAMSLLFYAALDLVVYLQFATAAGGNAMVLITIGNVSLLVIMAVAAANNAHAPLPLEGEKTRVAVGDDASTAMDEMAIRPEDQEQIIADIEALLLRKNLYRDVDLNLDRLARRLGIPARHVSVAINQRRSKNVSQFVNEFRVSEACSLLRSTDKPVTDIMFTVGFQTKSNFNREFRRVTGLTPIQWRNEDASRLKEMGQKLVQFPMNHGLPIEE